MKLNIALIQYDIIWEDVQANLEKLDKLFVNLPVHVNLIILPEMFATGFSMNPVKVAQAMDGSIVEWMKGVAVENDVAVLGSVAISEEGKFYNRAIWMFPSGDMQWYDKRHLFRIGGEDKHYKGGSERKIVEYKNVRFLLQVCYDLRFPVFSRNRNDYDVAIYMANWPESRSKVWEILLNARAIENQSYIIGVNRVGQGGGIKYIGGSACIDFNGNTLKYMNDNMDCIQYFKLDMNLLHQFKSSFPVHLDADEFTIQL
jgi:predicted amidohydrolase